MKRPSYIYSLFIFLCFVSCSTFEKDGGSDADAGKISFHVYDDVQHSTRGSDPITTQSMTIMGVFAGYEEEYETFGPSSVANDYINDVQYYRDHAGQDFAGSNVTYWPFSGKLSFFAYAPWIDVSNLHVPSTYTSGFLKFHFKQFENVTRQVDFCVAKPVLDQVQTESAIPLFFYHTLSQVLFSASYTGELPYSGLFVKIDKLTISGVIGDADLSMQKDSPFFVWDSAAATKTASYMLDRNLQYPELVKDAKLLEYVDDGSFVNISTASGRLYLIPHDSSGVTLGIKYGIYEEIGGVDVLRGSFVATCELPSVNWEPSKIYRYRFTIDVANNTIVNPDVSIVEWQTAIDSHGDNPIHLTEN